VRACLLATELARRAGLDARRQGEVYYGTLNTHTVHIYAKCGVSTRAGLAMFAMRHGLAPRPGRRRQDRLNSR
jgi:hypothetical protein